MILNIVVVSRDIYELLCISLARAAHNTSLPLLRVLSLPRETTYPQSCSLATVVVPSPVYTDVTWQWVYMSQQWSLAFH
jgi:hypothetical protein